MAREYFKIFHSYLEAIEPLNDEERGRLFTSLLEYSITGETPSLIGNERFVFPMMKWNIDRDVESYAEKAEANRRNGAKGGRPPKPKETEKTQVVFEKPNESEKSQDKDKDKDKDKDSIYKQPIFNEFSKSLQDTVIEWLKYKQQKGQSYKPAGLQTLLKKIRTAAIDYGDIAVIGSIENSMSNNYAGLFFDKLQKGGNGDGHIHSVPDRFEELYGAHIYRNA